MEASGLEIEKLGRKPNAAGRGAIQKIVPRIDATQPNCPADGGDGIVVLNEEIVGFGLLFTTGALEASGLHGGKAEKRENRGKATAEDLCTGEFAHVSSKITTHRVH